jgi:hypothetical protein
MASENGPAVTQTVVTSAKREADLYPLRCIEWTYYRRRLAEHGIRTITVSLSASYGATVATNRGRQFSAEEHARIKAMIEEGYDRRPFSDFVLRTDHDDIDTTLARLIALLS